MNFKHFINYGFIITFLLTAFISGSNLNYVSGDAYTNPVSLIGVSDSLHEKQSPSTYYVEGGHVYFSSDGWINSEVRFGGLNLLLGGLDFWDLPNVFVENFDNMNFNAWENYDSHSDNIDISIRFFDLPLIDSLDSASTLIGELELILPFNLYFDRYEIHEEWWEESVEIIEIYFRGNVNWLSLEQVMANAVPRGMEGFVENIDVSEANHFHFDIHYDMGFNDFISEFSIGWNQNWDTLSGLHDYSLVDLFHVTELKTSSLASNSLNLNIELPDVQNLIKTPWINDGNIQMNMDYHPNLDEPWYDNNIYSINIDIMQGYSVPDVSLQFEYDVKYWGITPSERAWYEVDPKGYESLDLQISGPNAKLTTGIGLDETILNNVQQIHFDYYRTAYEVANHTPIWLEISFMDDLDYQDQADSIAAIFETLLGVSFDANNSWVGYYWVHNLQTDVLTSNYNYEIFIYDFANFSTVFEASDAYTHSSMINESYYGLNFDRFSWDINYDFDYDFFNYHVRVEHNALDQYKEFPVKSYPESVSPIEHNFDVLDLFGWSSLPYSSETERFDIDISFPSEIAGQIQVIPEKDYGWGYNYWTWTEMMSQYNYQRLSISYFVDTPYTYDENHEKDLPVSTWTGSFNFAFLSDDIDTSPPSIGGLAYYDGSWEYNLDSGLEGIVTLGVDIWEDNDQYWNTTVNNWMPRYPSSGVSQVSGKMFSESFNYLNPKFVVLVEFSYDSMHNRYTTTIDFGSDQFMDGDWVLDIEAIDNSGNAGYNWYELRVDNYDDLLYDTPASLSWVSPTPPNNTIVHDSIKLAADIYDDIGVFAVILSINFVEFYLEDIDDDGVYLFDYNTLNSIDGKTYIKIETWDFEGHLTSSLMIYEVDNMSEGEPPSIIFVELAEGETISGQFMIKAEITDDIGIKAVTLEIHGHVSYVMELNPENNLYEYELDTTKLENDYYTLSITAIDYDENTHYETVTINLYIDNDENQNTIAVPGFTYLIAIFAIIPVSLAIVYRRRR